MEDKVHPLVELVLARIESHPEEFKAFSGPEDMIRPANRWDDAIYTINNHGSKADKDALNTKLDAMRMEEAHARMLDELLNGEERRRKEREAYEEERKRYAIQAAQVQAYPQNLSTAIQNPYLNAVAGAQALSYPRLGTAYDPITDTYGLGGTKITADQVQDNPGLVSSIKKALGL